MASLKLGNLNIVNSTQKHTATLYFFHGSGSSGNDVKEWVDILNRGELRFPNIKIIYPTAPAQPYTPNAGMLSNVWFDRKAVSIHVGEQVESVNKMCHAVSKLIDEEVSTGIPHNRIFVGGFSMGGALALHMAYRYKTSLGGCFAMSSFLNDHSVVYQHLKNSSDGRTPPLLQFHGKKDDLVPYEWAIETKTNLEKLGVTVQFNAIDHIGHELHRREIDTLKEWISKILSNKE